MSVNGAEKVASSLDICVMSKLFSTQLLLHTCGSHNTRHHTQGALASSQALQACTKHTSHGFPAPVGDSQPVTMHDVHSPFCCYFCISQHPLRGCCCCCCMSDRRLPLPLLLLLRDTPPSPTWLCSTLSTSGSAMASSLMQRMLKP